ncbi:hornerin-like [Lineus longissimus]|uniref:hornerin-like n=1 Tax=Lineus longissimus TaxID=88925 RepID=UPI002B4D7F76
MCITFDRKPRDIKYIVDGEVKVGRADHHDYVLPRSIVCLLSVIGTFLFVAGGIILMVGTFTKPRVLLPWGGVICGIGFLLCFIAILLCMHAHCIIPVDGYKIPSQPAKKNVVIVKRVESREDDRFANKRVFASGGSAGETGTLSSTHGRSGGETGTISSTHGRSGYISSGHSESTATHQAQSQSGAYQSGSGYATIGSPTGGRAVVDSGGGRAYGTMESSVSRQGGTQIVVQPSANYDSTAHSESHSSTARSVTVVDGNVSVLNGGQGVVVSRTDESVVPPTSAKQAVYVQVQPQSPLSGQQAQKMQSHAQKVGYAQIQAQGPAHSPGPQQEVIVVSNVQQQHSAPVGQLGGQVQSQGHGFSGGQQQYSYSTNVHQESVSGGQQQQHQLSSASAAPAAGFAASTGGHHYATMAGQPDQAGKQAVYYTQTTKTTTVTDGGHHDESSASSAGLLVPSHFHGEATPDMRYMRRDLSSMSNTSNMSGFSRPDSFGVERDDDFQYYPIGSDGSQQEQSSQSQQSYQYQYSVEKPQVQTQTQATTVTYNQSHSGGQYKGDRKGSIYENTLMQ